MTPQTPAYGRREARGQQIWADLAPPSDYEGQTYYGRPAIKPSHYKWLIASYLFTGGLAGASQIIAALADLFGREGDRSVVRAGRYLALLGAILSPIFLVRDLQTPKRFYNMMRIFRPTSPMSIGSWTLAAFGALSALAAVAQLADDTLARTRRPRRTGSAAGRWLGRIAGLPAAAGGMVMSCYTGSLLSSTSVPFWAVAPKLLPALFGASALSTAAAATALATERAGSSEQAQVAMERIALVASATEMAVAVACDRRWKRTATDWPIKQDPKLTAAYRFGALGLGIGVPLAIHAVHVLTGRRSSWSSNLASTSALAGGFIQRAVLTFAGNASAERPEDYFRFTSDSRNGRRAA